MDATLQAAVNTGLTGFASDATTQLGTVVPIALGLLVSIALIFFSVKMVRAIAHI